MFTHFCLSILFPSPGVRYTDCGFTGHVGVGKHLRKLKTMLLSSIAVLPKSFVKLWSTQPAGKMPVGTTAAPTMSTSSPTCWASWLVLAFKIAAGHPGWCGSVG